MANQHGGAGCDFTLICRDKYGGEKIPTLQEAVEECLRHQLTIVFDVKGQPDEVPMS